VVMWKLKKMSFELETQSISLHLFSSVSVGQTRSLPVIIMKVK